MTDYSKRLYRSEKDRMIAGVCGGLAQYLSIDPVIVRLIFLVGIIFGFSSSFWLYLIMWLIVPTESHAKDEPSQVWRGNVSEMKEKAKNFGKEVGKAFKSTQSSTTQAPVEDADVRNKESAQ